MRKIKKNKIQNDLKKSLIIIKNNFYLKNLQKYRKNKKTKKKKYQ